ncbi:MAG: DUF2235 domain-containing protein [Deltaproteobacteria bacterium]|nr:MAG: DUF2235 domain-containing protein [Deltaproteobacteria bacterium]
MKNIAICADGTGNTTIKGRGTNVFKLYEAVDQAGHRFTPGLTPQVALYHDGVGTESVKWFRLLTGATGWGLSRNVKQLYGELARVYAPGDKIFLFGFSRGAFTVRTLAGLIHACGVLDLSKYDTNAAFDDGVEAAYREYRQHYNSWLTRLFHKTQKLDGKRLAELRQKFSVAIPEFEDEKKHGKLIEFMGVWDTVDAVGLPIAAAEFVNRVIYAYKFPDRTLSTSVAHACHALALDEERENFKPVLWNESITTDPQRIEQVWFAGVHSNVGGGYPRQGMSLVALDWIMAKAEAAPHHLRFVAAERQMYRYHADVDDKLYDSRAGVGVFYRWLPRNVQQLCAENGITPKVHRSVFERIARNTEGYAPGSIPSDPEVISMSQPAAVTDAIRTLVRDHHRPLGPLIDRTATTQRIGRWSYRLFIYAVLLTVFFMVRGFVGSARQGTTTGWEVAVNLANTIFSSQWIGLALQVLWEHPWLIAWFALTLALALWVDDRLDRSYSQFWHEDNMRWKLRKVLGLG